MFTEDPRTGRLNIQAVVAKYDQNYRKRQTAYRAVSQTMSELLRQLYRVLDHTKHGTRINHTRWRRLSGQLVEHAGRLANHCRAEVRVIAYDNRDFVVLVNTTSTETYHSAHAREALRFVGTKRALLLMDLIQDISPLFDILLRAYGRGERFTSKDHRELAPFVGVLLKYAFYTSPLVASKRKLRSDASARHLYLQPFIQHMQRQATCA